VKRKDIETLVLAGAFDIFEVERAALLQSIDPAIENGTLFGDIRGDIDWLDGFYQMEERYPDAEPMPLMEKLSFEKELVGMYVSTHPLAHYRKAIRQRGCVSLTFLTEVALIKQSYQTVAFVEEVRVIRTKRGESMAFVQLTDEDATFEMVIFPEQFRSYKHILVEDAFVLIQVKLEERQEKKQGIIEDVQRFDFDDVKKEGTNKQAYFIQVINMSEQQVLNKLKPLVTKYPGDTPVMLYQKETQQVFKLRPEYYLETDYAVKKQLERLFGAENVKQKPLSRS
jgi:DNA polymerase-3 subunit alpha